jgi:hypothetical protein
VSAPKGDADGNRPKVTPKEMIGSARMKDATEAWGLGLFGSSIICGCLMSCKVVKEFGPEGNYCMSQEYS